MNEELKKSLDKEKEKRKKLIRRLENVLSLSEKANQKLSYLINEYKIYTKDE